MSTNKWFRLAIISIIIVAFYGTLMRYKIAFDFPYLNQKNLLHAHSHFAFNGWISHLLYTCLTWMASKHLTQKQLSKYYTIIIANLVAAFGMLVTFTYQGYAMGSFIFSGLTIIIGIVYAWFYIKDIKHFPANNLATPWIVTALLLNILSSAGPLSLAYTMITKNVNSYFYLGSVYYYLHFQYSGWFFFGAMALVVHALPKDFPSIKNEFRILAASAIPTFFLSILWTHLPTWLYIITVLFTVIQMVAWFMLLKKLLCLRTYKTNFPTWVNIFFYAAAFAMTIKFVLQTISVIPSLSQLVFGIRPIVIAYLHLVLLGVFSLFFIGFLFAKGWMATTPSAKTASILFLVGVFLNELLLGVQGMAAFAYIPIPYINQMLFAVALLLFLSAVFLLLTQLKHFAQKVIS